MTERHPLQDLADIGDLGRVAASGLGHDIAGGYAGIAELIRSRNADRAADAVRKVRERAYPGNPNTQALEASLPRLAGYFNPARLLPQDAQGELSRVGRNAGMVADNVIAGSPLLAAGLTAVPAAINPEGSELERVASYARGPQMLEHTPEALRLRKQFMGRDDKYWGISTDEKTDASRFDRTGYSGVQCTGYACAVRDKLGAQRVKIFGFQGDDNPTSEIGRQAGGHDFALVDGRYIVDPWLDQGFSQPLGDGLPERGVYDLLNPADHPAIDHLYGDKTAWQELKGAPSEPPMQRVRRGVRDPERPSPYPGIFKDPREIADEAEARVAPESPNLERLFGVTRADLAAIADRQGNVPGRIPGLAANPKGAQAAENIQTPANTRRLVNVLQAGQERAPQLMQGMKGWYVMDPVYQHLVEQFGEDEGKRRYDILNHLTGMNSPMSDVVTELNRGTGANMAYHQGDWDKWMKYGGMPAEERPMPGYEGVRGSTVHSTATGPAMDAYLQGGTIDMQSPKVPLYIQASSHPDLGFQTDTPVGDAHFSRGIGLADTRTTPAKYAESVTTPELATLRPWWQDVAGQADLQPVPGQSSLWGLMGPQTGVRTVLGQPKLEILADMAVKAAERMRTTPENALNIILGGKGHAGAVVGALGAGAAGAASLSPQDEPQQ